MKNILTLGIGLLIGLVAFAQPGYNWPEDPAKREQAEEFLVTLSDDLRAKNYNDAIPKVEWLVENAPNVHKSLYINGAKVYSSFVKSSKGDNEKVNLYEDKTLEMYDLRIKYFGKEGDVLNRKGQKAWVMLKDRPEKMEELFNLYKKIYELMGIKMYSANTVAYMDMACKMKGAQKMDDMQVMEVYDNISLVLEAHAADKGYQKMKGPIDGKLAGCVKISCEQVKETFYPKFQAKPELKMAKTIFRQMNSGGCTNDPIFFEMMEYIDELEPSCGMKLTMAKKASRAKEYDKALKYYKASMEACPKEKDAELYYEMAAIYKKKGDKIATRTYARKSIAAGSSHKSKAYSLIGDLYFSSFKTCATADLVKSRATYIAAYNQYKMAGNSKMMKKAKEQFPSAEEIFTKGMKVGTELTVGCWINEKVILTKRPAGE